MEIYDMRMYLHGGTNVGTVGGGPMKAADIKALSVATIPAPASTYIVPGLTKCVLNTDPAFQDSGVWTDVFRNTWCAFVFLRVCACLCSLALNRSNYALEAICTLMWILKSLSTANFIARTKRNFRICALARRSGRIVLNPAEAKWNALTSHPSPKPTSSGIV